MKNYNQYVEEMPYRSGRNVMLAVYTIIAITLISAYTVVQLLQIV